MADGGATRWARHLAPERAPRTALLAALLLGLTFLASGIFMDDYHQLLLLDGNSPYPLGRWDLFNFAPKDPEAVRALIAHGPLPWWMEPTTWFTFVRPLSVALMQFDHAVFGRAFWAAHLHSLAWSLALVAAVAALLRRALGATSAVAALATVLFAIDGSHALPAGWLANRNALVALTPVVLGLLAHLRWREDRDWRFLPLSLLAFTVGLAGGETAVSALAYLAAYELLAGPGGWRARLLALLPALALGAVYVWAYGMLGAGTAGSELYVDPVGEPLRYLALAPGRALTLVASLFLGQLANAWILGSAARVALAVLGALTVAGLLVLGRRAWPGLEDQERRGLRWLVLGAALSLLPVVSSFPMARLQLVASLGAAAMAATLLRAGWRARDRLARWGARVLALTTVGFALLGWPLAAVAIRSGSAVMERTALQTALSDAALTGRVVVFAGPDPTTALYADMVRRFHGRPPAQSWVTLSFVQCTHRLRRVAPDAVELELVDGRFLELAFELLVRRADVPVELGHRVPLDGIELEVVGLDQGKPNRLRLRFDASPEDGAWTLATYDGERLVPVTLPPVGQSLDLPRARSLLSM